MGCQGRMTMQPGDSSNAISRRVARGIRSHHRPGRLPGQVDGLLAQSLMASLGAIATQVLHDRVTQRMRAENIILSKHRNFSDRKDLACCAFKFGLFAGSRTGVIPSLARTLRNDSLRMSHRWRSGNHPAGSKPNNRQSAHVMKQFPMSSFERIGPYFLCR